MNTIETKMLADELTKYINEKHTQEECVGFSDGFELALQLAKNNEVLDLVSNRCTEFAAWIQEKQYNKKMITHPNNVGKWYSDYEDNGYLTDKELFNVFLNVC